MIGLLPGYKKCFFCGPVTGGLALELHYQEKKAFCEFVAHEKFQGFDGTQHGGIVTGILDEVMWWIPSCYGVFLAIIRNLEKAP